MGSNKHCFTILSGNYSTHLPGCYPLKKNQTEVRVTYEGCDYLCLPPSQKMPDLYEGGIIKIPSVSNQTLLRCTVNQQDRLFYINKSERTILEIHGVNIDEVAQLAIATPTEKPKYYQPESIPLDKTQAIASLIGYQPLHEQAKRAKNIEVKLSQEERRQTLMMLDDHTMNFRNTSYTYAFQAHLAKYMHESLHEKVELTQEIKHQETLEQTSTSSPWQSLTKALKKILWTSPEEKLAKIEALQHWSMHLHRLSARFKAFDGFINHRGPNPKTTLENLKKTFEEYRKEVNDDLDKIMSDISSHDPSPEQKNRILLRLKAQLKVGMDDFERQLESLEKNPTKEQIDRLVSIADRDVFIGSLGGFMQAQMTLILRAGIQVTYKINNQRVKDVIQVPRLVAQLSDAKHLMLIKGQSIVEGPKDNDTYSAIPAGMLAATTEADPLGCKSKEERWFSIKPYLKTWNPARVDKILCLITGHAASDNNRHGSWFYHGVVQPLKLITSVFEIAFSIPRLGLVLTLGLVETLLFALSWQHKPTELKWTYRLNQSITRFYRDYAFILAPLTYLKHAQWNAYKRQDEAASTHLSENPASAPQVGGYVEVLESCTDNTGFCYSLFIYFTPQLISESILDFFRTISRQMLNVPQEISYLTSYHQDAKETFELLKSRHQIIGKLNTLLAKRLRDAEKPRQTDEYETLSYCTINHISSPLDVFYEVMVTLSNGVVNPMFRKSPGIATFFFAISISTLATFILPAPALAWLKSVPAWLKYPAEQISLHFTGKSTALGIQEQVVACFLEWKLGFFATEFLVEIGHGHFEIFEPLFEEPEQIVLGLVGLINLGVVLKYLPKLPTSIPMPGGLPDIPNYYFMIINVFSEEARDCAHGTIGATSIEYGFLGLKFAMLMHSMLSGSESRESPSALQRLVLACGQPDFFKKLMTKFQTQNVAISLKQADFREKLNKALTRHDDKTIFDDPSLGSVDNSFFEARRPAADPRDPENLLNAQYECTGIDRDGSREQVAGRRDLNCQQTLEEDNRIQAIVTILTDAVNEILTTQTLRFETQELSLFKTALAQQLLDMPGFLNLNATQKQAQNILVPTKPSHETNQPTINHQDSVEPLSVCEAYQALREAIRITQDPDNPLIFSPRGLGLIKEANQYYDYLDHCFEAYNQALKRDYGSNANYQTLYLNKRDYLDVFFNKHCYQPSNNLIRSLIFFTYPLTAVWRVLKFLFATVADKPSMQHQIVKNFCKDLVLVSQIVGPLARMTADFNLYLTGTVRGMAFLTTLPIALGLYAITLPFAKIGKQFGLIQSSIPSFSDWFEFLDDWICYLIAFHRTPGLPLIRQLFVRASRIAGSNKDLVQAAEKMNQDLDEIASLLNIPLNKSTQDSTLLTQRLLSQNSKNNQTSDMSYLDLARWPPSQKSLVNLFYSRTRSKSEGSNYCLTP